MAAGPRAFTIVSVATAAAATSLSIVTALALVGSISGVGSGLEWLFSPLEWPLVVCLYFAPLVAPAGALVGAFAVVSGLVAVIRGAPRTWPVTAVVLGGALALFEVLAWSALVLPLLENAWG